MAPESNRQERHVATSPPLPPPSPMPKRPTVGVIVAVTAICTALGGAVGAAGAWAVGFGASAEGVLLSLGCAAVVGAAALTILVRRSGRNVPTTILGPVEQDGDGESSEPSESDSAAVLNRRTFFERASALAGGSVSEHCVVVIDVNRPNVLSEDPGEITEDPTSDAFGQMVAVTVDADAIVGRLATAGFGLVFPETAPEQGRSVCERVRHFQPEGWRRSPRVLASPTGSPARKASIRRWAGQKPRCTAPSSAVALALRSSASATTPRA